jgi:hypothetical protein
MLIPLMRDRDQIDSLYSIFVLDLCFVMPAFLFVGVGLIRKQGWALLMAPGMFVLGSVLMASLTIAELAKPIFGQPFIVAGVLPPLALAVLFAALAGVHLRNLQFKTNPDHATTDPLQSTTRF